MLASTMGSCNSAYIQKAMQTDYRIHTPEETDDWDFLSLEAREACVPSSEYTGWIGLPVDAPTRQQRVNDMIIPSRHDPTIIWYFS